MAGEIDAGDGAWVDRLGHGTAVMAAIQEKAPDAAYFAVKVFHDALQTRALVLVRAIDWCLKHDMDVINLSLGTVNATYTEAFVDVVARCANRGTLLVAAREANGTPCYPGCLPGVFGVGLDWDVPRDTYRVEAQDGRAVFYASGYPRPIPGVPQTRNLYGISFAVANMCGLIIRQSGQEAATGPARFAAVEASLSGSKPA
jgi:subtilisin family serine protease